MSARTRPINRHRLRAAAQNRHNCAVHPGMFPSAQRDFNRISPLARPKPGTEGGCAVLNVASGKRSAKKHIYKGDSLRRNLLVCRQVIRNLNHYPTEVPAAQPIPPRSLVRRRSTMHLLALSAPKTDDGRLLQDWTQTGSRAASPGVMHGIPLKQSICGVAPKAVLDDMKAEPKVVLPVQLQPLNYSCKPDVVSNRPAPCGIQKSSKQSWSDRPNETKPNGSRFVPNGGDSFQSGPNGLHKLKKSSNAKAGAKAGCQSFHFMPSSNESLEARPNSFSKDNITNIWQANPMDVQYLPKDTSVLEPGLNNLLFQSSGSKMWSQPLITKSEFNNIRGGNCDKDYCTSSSASFETDPDYIDYVMKSFQKQFTCALEPENKSVQFKPDGFGENLWKISSSPSEGLNKSSNKSASIDKREGEKPRLNSSSSSDSVEVYIDGILKKSYTFHSPKAATEAKLKGLFKPSPLDLLEAGPSGMSNKPFGNKTNVKHTEATPNGVLFQPSRAETGPNWSNSGKELLNSHQNSYESERSYQGTFGNVNEYQTFNNNTASSINIQPKSGSTSIDPLKSRPSGYGENPDKSNLEESSLSARLNKMLPSETLQNESKGTDRVVIEETKLGKYRIGNESADVKMLLSLLFDAEKYIGRDHQFVAYEARERENRNVYQYVYYFHSDPTPLSLTSEADTSRDSDSDNPPGMLDDSHSPLASQEVPTQNAPALMLSQNSQRSNQPIEDIFDLVTNFFQNPQNVPQDQRAASQMAADDDYVPNEDEEYNFPDLTDLITHITGDSGDGNESSQIAVTELNSSVDENLTGTSTGNNRSDRRQFTKKRCKYFAHNVSSESDEFCQVISPMSLETLSPYSNTSELIRKVSTPQCPESPDKDTLVENSSTVSENSNMDTTVTEERNAVECACDSRQDLSTPSASQTVPVCDSVLDEHRSKITSQKSNGPTGSIWIQSSSEESALSPPESAQKISSNQESDNPLSDKANTRKLSSTGMIWIQSSPESSGCTPFETTPVSPSSQEQVPEEEGAQSELQSNGSNTEDDGECSSDSSSNSSLNEEASNSIEQPNQNTSEFQDVEPKNTGREQGPTSENSAGVTPRTTPSNNSYHGDEECISVGLASQDSKTSTLTSQECANQGNDNTNNTYKTSRIKRKAIDISTPSTPKRANIRQGETALIINEVPLVIDSSDDEDNENSSNRSNVMRNRDIIVIDSD